MTTTPLFTSARERRLWLWTLAAVAAVYSTLGPGRAIADALRARGLLGTSFAVVVGALVLVLAIRFVRSRPGWGEIGVALGVAFAFWVAMIRIENPGERTHLVEYGVVAALLHQALLERSRNGRVVPMPAALAMGVTALLGVLDESIQASLPDRVFDLRDIGFNAIAGFMVIAARLALVPQRGPGWRVWFLWLMAAAFGWGNGVYWGWYTATEPKTLARLPDALGAGFLGLAVGAAAMAALQAMVLRQFMPRAWRWMLATLAAALAMGAVMFGLDRIDPHAGWLLGVILLGPLLAVSQWWLLRHHVRDAGWWLVATTLAWGPALWFGDVVGPPGFGAVYGSITGAALVWLLRRADADAAPAASLAGGPVEAPGD